MWKTWPIIIVCQFNYYDVDEDDDCLNVMARIIHRIQKWGAISLALSNQSKCTLLINLLKLALHYFRSI